MDEYLEEWNFGNGCGFGGWWFYFRYGCGYEGYDNGDGSGYGHCDEDNKWEYMEDSIRLKYNG
jgi:hypothetical protein